MTVLPALVVRRAAPIRQQSGGKQTRHLGC